MEVALIRCTIFLMMLAAARSTGGQTATPPANAADRAAGEKIFRSHCASCHGLNGAGGSGPSLTTGIFYHGSTDADLYRNISEGIPGTAMPDQFFSSAQIWQIVAYVRAVSSRPVRPQSGQRVHRRSIVSGEGLLGMPSR